MPVYYISSLNLSILRNCNFVPLAQHLPPPPVPAKHSSLLCYCEFEESGIVSVTSQRSLGLSPGVTPHNRGSLRLSCPLLSRAESASLTQ